MQPSAGCERGAGLHLRGSEERGRSSEQHRGMITVVLRRVSLASEDGRGAVEIGTEQVAAGTVSCPREVVAMEGEDGPEGCGNAS